MAYAPKHPCTGKGPRRGRCPNLISRGVSYCVDCQPYEKARARAYDKERDETPGRRFLHSTTWRRIAKAKLDRDPLCERCLKDEPAVLVHHIDRNELNNVPENHKSLCTEHHEAEHRHERWGR